MGLHYKGRRSKLAFSIIILGITYAMTLKKACMYRNLAQVWKGLKGVGIFSFPLYFPISNINADRTREELIPLERFVIPVQDIYAVWVVSIDKTNRKRKFSRNMSHVASKQ